MRPTEAQIRRLVRVCRDRLGNPRLLKAPEGYPGSLAQCAIDAIQSPGATPASVKKVLTRYRAYRVAQGGDPATDGVVALLGTFHDLGSADAWARTIGDAGRTPSEPDAPLKAAAIEAAATALSDIEIYSAADLREVVNYPEHLPTVHAAWTGVVAQGSGVTWRRLLTLAGVPGVRPDRVVVRFVAGALGVEPPAVEPEFAAAAIELAAVDLGVEPITLDQAIWRWQRTH